MRKETKQQSDAREAKAWLKALAARADEARQHVGALSARDDVAESVTAVLRIAESGVFDVLGALRLVATLGIGAATEKADGVAVDDEELHRLMLWFERVEQNPASPNDDRTPGEVGADRKTSSDLMASVIAGRMRAREIEFVRGLVSAIFAAGASSRAPKKHRAEAVLRATALGGKRHLHDEFVRDVDEVTNGYEAFGDPEREKNPSHSEATALAIRHVLASKAFANTLSEEDARKEVARARKREKTKPR